MTQTYETTMNPFIGNACGKFGRVVVTGGALFTGRETLTVIAKQRPFVNDWPTPAEQTPPIYQLGAFSMDEDLAYLERMRATHGEDYGRTNRPRRKVRREA